jgi:flagellin-like hook-associated protein FlgL
LNSTTLTLPNINSTALGGAAGTLNDLTSGGSANMIDGDLSKADKIIASAQSQVNLSRASFGSFDKNVIDTSSAVLGAMQISLSSSLSQIADTDVAQSMSSLVRDEILAKATMKSIIIANRSRGMVLELLAKTDSSSLF